MAATPPVLAEVSEARPRASGWWVVVVSCLALLGFAVLHLFAPEEHGFYPKCGLYTLTGLHCPGCGSLRALHHLSHGEVLAALDSNAVLTLGLIVSLVWGLARWWRGRLFPWQRALTGGRGVVVGMVLVVLFGVLRNLPWFPFVVLAP